MRYADEFRAVRAETGLKPSRVLPPPSSNPSSSLRRTQTSQPTTPTTRPSDGLSRTRTTAGPTTTRPVVEDGDEPPPPPYASQDPEPESTRMLQERLTAEAEAEGRVAPSIPTPQPSSSTSHNPARSPATSTVYDPPPGAPPRRSPSGPSRPTISTSTFSSVRRPSPPPEGPPSDEEVAKVWEESQLDEAKRASIAAERERAELEQVMQLSLAEAEASSRAQGESESGPGGWGMHTVSDDEDDGPRSRRFSSYDLPARAAGGSHRRVASDAGATGNIPGSWQNQPGASAFMMDDQDQLASLPALTPSRTGPVLKSKNPFLSPLDREHAQPESQSSPAATQAGLDMGSPQSARSQSGVSPHFGGMERLSPASASRQPSASSFRDGPGSAFTKYTPGGTNKALPPSPSPEQRNALPPGRPPVNMRVSSQGALMLPNLPPRPSTSHPFSPTGESSRPLPRPPSENSRVGSGKLPNHANGEDPLEMLKHYDTVFLGVSHRVKLQKGH